MPEKRYAIGVDLGGTNIKVGLVADGHKLVGKKSGKTDPCGRSWQDVVADIARLADSLLAEQGVGVAECVKMGVGSPGMIDHINGNVVFAGNLEWADVPLLSELRRYFELPMRLSNDANCATLGEVVAGAAKGARDVVMVTLGTGVGGGVVADGRLQEGGSAGGMELGHTLIMLDGEECTCGRRGCFEAYASASALVRQARSMATHHKDSLLRTLCRDGELANMNGRIPFQAAQRGDPYAQIVIDNYIRYLGEGIINFINAWRPEKVLLGGGISNEGEPLLAPLNEYVKPRTFAGERGFVAPILRAALGNDAGVVGAASL